MYLFKRCWFLLFYCFKFMILIFFWLQIMLVLLWIQREKWKVHSQFKSISIIQDNIQLCKMILHLTFSSWCYCSRFSYNWSNWKGVCWSVPKDCKCSQCHCLGIQILEVLFLCIELVIVCWVKILLYLVLCFFRILFGWFWFDLEFEFGDGM